MEASTDQKNFHDIMRIMAVNIGQNYFHNEYFRFAQILIMKIILTDIHGIFPHNDVKIFLVCTRFHNEKSLPVRQIT